MIKAFLLTIYLFIILPLIIGADATLMTKHRTSFSFLYVSGYAICLSFFETFMIFQGSRDNSYLQLVESWHLWIIVFSVIAVCIMIASIISLKKRTSIITICPISRTNLITVIFTIVLIILSIGFFVPHAQDQTPELARLTIKSSRLFSIDPYTGAEYTNASSCPGYLFLIYALGSTLTGIDVTIFIHLFMPVIFIPFFVCCYSLIASILFPEMKQKNTRTYFVWLIMLFYLLMIPFETHIAFAPYRNIWNGITLASSCLLPLYASLCIDITRHFFANHSEIISMFSILKWIAMIIILSFSIMLCIRFGLMLAIILIISTIGTGIIACITHKLSSKKEGA